MKSGSKKAFEHNVKAEMEANPDPKDRAKNLAIAYSVKRKAKKKKYAEGGAISAKDEKRPMPDAKHNDAKEAARNDGNKPPHNDSWTSQPDKADMQKNNGRMVKPIKYPKMMGSSAFQARLRDEEDDLQRSAAPGEPGAQPSKALDEEGADRQGPESEDLHMKKMAEGGIAIEMGAGPEEDNEEHPAGLESDNDQMKPADSDYMEEHDAAQFAEGGMAHSEEELEHAASLAAAIMARRKFARGGAILSEDSMESDDSDQADLSRNAEEDANMEDKASFDALRKENYSESDGLNLLDSPMDSAQHGHAEEDDHDEDVVSAIRRKMRNKSPISR